MPKLLIKKPIVPDMAILCIQGDKAYVFANLKPRAYILDMSDSTPEERTWIAKCLLLNKWVKP